jgi:hypothetical protein
VAALALPLDGTRRPNATLACGDGDTTTGGHHWFWVKTRRRPRAPSAIDHQGQVGGANDATGDARPRTPET